MPQRVKELTAENFETAVLQASRPVLVEFWAPWCGPCRTMAPVVDELAEELAGSLDVGRLDVEREGAPAERFQVFSIPTLILFADGRVRKRIIGALPKTRLLDELERHLSA